MNNDSATVRAARSGDGPALAQLYARFVQESTATFELDLVSAEEIDRRRAEVPRGIPWLLAEDAAGALLGYACIASWKPRGGYRDTIEASVYVDPDQHRRGIGRMLYAALLPRCWAAGFHAILAGISLPNEASVRFHEGFGFRPVGRLREVGEKFGRRIDVGYWQLLREVGRRRSDDEGEEEDAW